MCGMEFGRMSQYDDVWMKHAQKSPTCRLVLREKGEEFVQQTLAALGPYREPRREPRLQVQNPGYRCLLHYASNPAQTCSWVWISNHNLPGSREVNFYYYVNWSDFGPYVIPATAERAVNVVSNGFQPTRSGCLTHSNLSLRRAQLIKPHHSRTTVTHR